MRKLSFEEMNRRGITSDWLRVGKKDVPRAADETKDAKEPRDANNEDDPLPMDELTEDEALERCEEHCVHLWCMTSTPGGAPSGPGSYCDRPFTDVD